MAGIDHTILLFKNGKAVRNCDLDFDKLPFEMNRDGKILCFKDKKEIPFLKIKGDYAFTLTKAETGKMKKAVETLKAIFPAALAEESVCYLYDKDGVLIFGYCCEEYNAFFYNNGKDTFTVLGGYGHLNNPYTHFINRGFPKKTEARIYKEAYDWLIEDVFEDLVDYINCYFRHICKEYEEWDKYNLKDIKKTFGYKTYWDMTDAERTQYIKIKEISFDSLKGENKLTIKLDEKYSLSCELLNFDGSHPEISIVIEENGVGPVQDIALVRPHQKKDQVQENEHIDVLVWGDRDNEDYTQKTVISRQDKIFP